MGYGDDLMATGRVREVKNRFPDHKILIGDGEKEYVSPIFWNNPNIDRAIFLKRTDKVVWVYDYPGNRPYIDYGKSTREKQIFIPRFKAQKGELYFTEAEIQTARRELEGLSSFIVIGPNVDSYIGKNKDWGFERWQEVVNRLSGEVHFVQLGSREQKSLRGVRRMVTENFRSACTILSFAELFVGTEGALHHAAAALGIPAVVIFGGRISPELTGYGVHTNLYADLPGSPCGRIAECDHCRQSMKKISVNQVVDSIEACYSAMLCAR